MGIGGATGVSAIIYTFVKVSQFLDDDLLQDAQSLSAWLTPECIAADTQLDILSGAAGAILGLLSLYRATKTTEVLDKAIVCGQHLLTHQVSHAGAPKAWQTFGAVPMTGFSHGAAGISYALLRLYAATQDHQYLEAAQEGMEYERSVFSVSHANWPDFRRPGQTENPVFVSQWCHGAPGIGLGRLGSLEVVKTPKIEHEIAMALRNTQLHALQAVDHLCCGNLGRVEVLFIGAQSCARPDWYQAAFQGAMHVVARAKQTGAYQLFANLPHVFNPGFFQGTAGIGYQLLRLARPAQLPSVLLWE
jgi:type 2 lantibiotic biosynthesis protein LanM